MSKNILKGTSIVASLTLVSRLLGFVWNLVMARVFGAGSVTDVFFVAYRIPNLMRSFLAEGALSAAFVPVFAEDLHTSKTKAGETLRSLISLLLITTIVLSILGIIFAPQIVALLAPGIQDFETCVQLTRIALPYIIFVSFVAVVNAALNNLKIYGAAPLAQIVMNLALIAGALLASFYNPKQAITIVTYAVIAGGLIQVLIQFPILKRASLIVWPSKNLITNSTKKIIKLFLPAMLGASVYQFNILINTVLASLLPTGSISWLFYADRISQLPVGLLTIALASVLLPALSESAASNQQENFTKDLTNSLRYISFLIIPAAFGLIALAEPLTQLLFERGSFTSFDTRQTALAIQATSFGIWGMSCYTIVVRGFLAKQDTLTPSLFAVAILIINFFIALILMGPIQTSGDNQLINLIASFQSLIAIPGINFAHAGLALSSGMSGTFVLLLAVVILQKRGSWELSSFLKSCYKSLIAGFVMYLTIIQVLSFEFESLLLILIALPLACLTYAFALLLLQSQELTTLLRKVL